MSCFLSLVIIARHHHLHLRSPTCWGGFHHRRRRRRQQLTVSRTLDARIHCYFHDEENRLKQKKLKISVCSLSKIFNHINNQTA